MHQTLVKIAASNLAIDLERVLGVSVKVLADDSTGHDRKSDSEWDWNEETAEILIRTAGSYDGIRKRADFIVLYDDASGGLRKEAYVHRIVDGRLVIAGSDRRGTVQTTVSGSPGYRKRVMRMRFTIIRSKAETGRF